MGYNTLQHEVQLKELTQVLSPYDNVFAMGDMNMYTGSWLLVLLFCHHLGLMCGCHFVEILTAMVIAMTKVRIQLQHSREVALAHFSKHGLSMSWACLLKTVRLQSKGNENSWWRVDKVQDCTQWSLWSVYRYNIASKATQSNSVYVNVLKIPRVLADGVSKSLRQNFLFLREQPLSPRGKIFYLTTIMDTNKDLAH